MKNRFFRSCAAVLAALALICTCCSAAFADPAAVEVDGTVINTAETPVTTAYTGSIETLTVRAGDPVKKGDVIATLKTTRVYATLDGTVRLFGEPGDSAAMVVSHYGAVAYIEPDIALTVSASTRTAYDAEENKIIHPGEKVFLRGSSTLTHTGAGAVTQVTSSGFTVDITEGNFESGDSINVYRAADFDNTSRIGRGSASRSDYTAFEGSGIIAAYRVENGSKVKKGDLLFETVDGEYAGSAADLTEIRAPEDGVISSVSVSTGSSVTAGDTVCALYPDSSLRVEASVNEESLSYMQAGNAVTVHFTYLNGGEYMTGGTVEKVSSVGAAEEGSESEEAFFKAIIRLDDLTGVSYGLTVTVTN